MLREVEVGAAVDAFHLLEAEGHVELDVGGGVGIVGQLVVVVEAVVLCAEAQVLMPLHAGLLPLGEPLELGAGLDEELHLHLLELAHAEDELAGHNLVAEGLTYLCDAEGQLHAAGLLHVEVVDEDALSRLGTQVDGGGAVGRAAHLGLEHEVELAHLGPVACAADGAYDSLVEDDLLQAFEVDAAFCVHHLMDSGGAGRRISVGSRARARWWRGTVPRRSCRRSACVPSLSPSVSCPRTLPSALR